MATLISNYLVLPVITQQSAIRNPPMPDYRYVVSEEAKIKTLRGIVDDCAGRLKNEDFSREDAIELIESTRRKVLGLFPGKEEQFELIYRPRFLRILEERTKNDKGLKD